MIGKSGPVESRHFFTVAMFSLWFNGRKVNIGHVRMNKQALWKRQIDCEKTRDDDMLCMCHHNHHLELT